MSTELTPATPVATVIRISQYEKLESEIMIATQEAKGKTFDYKSQDGNKAARSYLHTLKKLNGEIERARVEAKAYALDYGRRVDALARELKTKVEVLMAPHDKEIKAIDEAEAKRKAVHRAAIDHIKHLRTATASTAIEVKNWIGWLDGIIMELMEEYADEARAEREQTKAALMITLRFMEEKEAQAAEVARLRAEAAAREEAERADRIRREAVEQERERAAAAERKRVADEAAAQAIRQDQERRQREIEARRQAETQEALKRAEEARAEAVRRAAEAEQRERDAAARREAEAKEAADRAERFRTEHRDRILGEIQADIDTWHPIIGGTVADVLASGNVRHVSITWGA